MIDKNEFLRQIGLHNAPLKVCRDKLEEMSNQNAIAVSTGDDPVWTKDEIEVVRSCVRVENSVTSE